MILRASHPVGHFCGWTHQSASTLHGFQLKACIFDSQISGIVSHPTEQKHAWEIREREFFGKSSSCQHQENMKYIFGNPFYGRLNLNSAELRGACLFCGIFCWKQGCMKALLTKLGLSQPCVCTRTRWSPMICFICWHLSLIFAGSVGQHTSNRLFLLKWIYWDILAYSDNFSHETLLQVRLFLLLKWLHLDLNEASD